MRKDKIENPLQDCYDVHLTSTGEYYGTIKVRNKAGIDEKIKRVHKLLPKLRDKLYMIDYTLEFQGTFRKC